MSIASLGHCEKTGKISHPTRDGADAHLKQLVWMNASQGKSHLSAGLNVYPCDNCNGWHVGHQESIPLVWHYTIGKKLTPISSSGELRPRRPQKLTANQQRSMSPGERKQARNKWDAQEPLLWFSRRLDWEPSVIKFAPSKPFPNAPPPGRCWDEVKGEGLIRFGVFASVAKLRWGDFLNRNPMPLKLRDAITRRGDPTRWLATDQVVPLKECRAMEMYYGGAWVPAESLDADAVELYLEGRPSVYAEAWKTLLEKLGGFERVAAGDILPPTMSLSEPEAVLYEDVQQAQLERGAK